MKGLSVKELQDYFGFEDPQAIYKWQQGRSLPRADHLFALSVLLGVTMEQILVPAERKMSECEQEPQEYDCDSFLLKDVKKRLTKEWKWSIISKSPR